MADWTRPADQLAIAESMEGLSEQTSGDL